MIRGKNGLLIDYIKIKVLELPHRYIQLMKTNKNN
jgi:hypothetical protein